VDAQVKNDEARWSNRRASASCDGKRGTVGIGTVMRGCCKFEPAPVLT